MALRSFIARAKPGSKRGSSIHVAGTRSGDPLHRDTLRGPRLRGSADPRDLLLRLVLGVVVLRGVLESVERARRVVQTRADHAEVEPRAPFVLERHGLHEGLLAGLEIA